TGAIAQIVGMFVGASIDRFGRKRALIATRVLFAAILYPAYVMLISPQASPLTVIAINMLLNVVFGAGLGAYYAFIPELFPKSVRASGLSIMYALGTTIFGGTTQFVVAALIEWTGDPMMPAFYQIAATIVAIVGLAFLAPHEEVVR